jgi:hypothetical protein
LIAGGIAVGLVAAGVWAALPAAAAGSACSTSGPTGGAYSVTLCITSPGAGSTLTGTSSVTDTISVTGTNPGVQELEFTLNGSDLLWSFQKPYSWTLDTKRFVDGSYSLQVFALMRDGFSTAQASETVSFSNGITSPPVNTNTFTPTTGTAAPPGQPLMVAAVGDGASGQTAETNVVNLIGTWHPNLFLYLGDVYENGRPMEFNNWYGNPGTAGTYGQFHSITDPVTGNHEYDASDHSGYQWYWNNPPHYYSYNAGGWHFVALDNIPTYLGSSTSSSNYVAETTWLQNDLTSNTNPCTIVYYHEPLFNVGKEGSAKLTAGIWQILAAHHVTLVLNGHDHDYQRWEPLDGSGNPSPTGVTEIIDGAGGHGVQSQVTTDSRLVASDFKDAGAMQLALGTAGLGYQFVSSAGTTVDSGSIPCFGSAPDKTPPSVPQNLTATAPTSNQVQLSWTASTDDVGVTGYDVFRNGTKIATTSPQTNYLDATAQPGTTYSYTVDARDAAGNTSAQSKAASVTTPTGASVFFDGFETGDMSHWTTSTNMVVQTAVVSDGTFAAEGQANSSAAFAYKQLSKTYTSLYYSTRFNIISQGSQSSAYLLRLRTATKGAIAALLVNSKGKLELRNDVTKAITTSSTVVSQRTWHTLELFGSINGTSGQISVWLDGSPIGALTGTQNLGTNPIGFLQLGDTSTTAISTVAYDDVRADTSFIKTP